MNKKDISYIGLELTPKSKTKLLNMTELPVLISFFNSDAKMYCHHMTVVHYTQLNDEIYKWCKKMEGQEFTLTAIELGISDKAIAIKVKTTCKSINKLKHITIATLNGGSPVDSNYIEKWISITPFRLQGILTFYKKQYL